MRINETSFYASKNTHEIFILNGPIPPNEFARANLPVQKIYAHARLNEIR